MRWILRVLLLAFVVAADACSEPCTLIQKHGIVLTIVDGATGSPFEGDVTVIVTDGSYTETVNPPLFPPGARTAFLASERPGDYRIEVQAPGYVTWVATNVRVTRDDCHVETVELTAELEPLATT